jgi:hypothetical protein
MNAKAAAESSILGLAVRYDQDGCCWLFHQIRFPHLLIATDIPDGDQKGDVCGMLRVTGASSLPTMIGSRPWRSMVPMSAHSTRSPDRPNSLSLHRATKREFWTIGGIGPIEAMDGTLVIDIKSVLSGPRDF